MRTLREAQERAFDHVAIAHRLCRSGPDQIFVRCETGDREIGFVSAARVEHSGVDRAVGLRGHFVADQRLQRCARIPALDEKLRERAHVEHCNSFAAGAMLLCHPGMPVLVTPAVFDARLGGRGREEIRPLPSHLRAEAGAALPQVVIERRAAEGSRGFEFAIRPRHLVVHAEHFGDAVGQPGLVAVEARKAPDVDRPQVERGLAREDPLG